MNISQHKHNQSPIPSLFKFWCCPALNSDSSVAEFPSIHLLPGPLGSDTSI